jgi:probable DNA metabolism protein
MILRAHETVANYRQWLDSARQLLVQRVPPEEVVWTAASDAQDLLFEPEPADRSRREHGTVMMPRAFFAIAEPVSRHSSERRWDLLYRAAWRIMNGERNLLEIETDDTVAKLNAMRRSVEKDIYRMRQFIRFRKVDTSEGPNYVAWYEPEHHTLDANGKFFVSRFGSMRWAILTPRNSLVWNLEKLEHGPGVPRSHAPPEEELEDLWRLYYATIFNPARLKLNAMRAQLPVGRWNNLPESRVIPELVRMSRGCVDQMIDNQPVSASDFIPHGASLSVLREAVKQCGACDLCGRATQPVWGEGNAVARIALVGEQPGDEEDQCGRPFVGPAGRVLDEALEAAGLIRSELYLTNSVKAFRFEERGKRRIHQTPRSRDIAVCRPWLQAEMDLVRPEVIVCLGASAAQSVLGKKVGIGSERGHLIALGAARVAITYHPSAVLRAPEETAQRELFNALVEDLSLVKETVETIGGGKLSA